MDLGIVFAIIAGILILGTILKILKFGLKIVSLIFIVLLFISLGFGFFIYKDLTSIQQNWPDSDKLLILANDNVYAAMITTFGEDKEPVTLNNIKDYQAAYQNKDYETMLGSNYLLFIFKLNMFDKSEDQLDFNGAKINQKEIINAIESNDSLEYIAYELIKQGKLDSEHKIAWITEVKKEAGEDIKFKGMLFGLVLQKEMINDSLFVFKQFSKGNILIYPKHITFKLIKAVPFSLIEGVAKRVIKNKL